MTCSSGCPTGPRPRRLAMTGIGPSGADGGDNLVHRLVADPLEADEAGSFGEPNN